MLVAPVAPLWCDVGYCSRTVEVLKLLLPVPGDRGATVALLAQAWVYLGCGHRAIRFFADCRIPHLHHFFAILQSCRCLADNEKTVVP